MIVRRERPHPGGQLSLFDTIAGLRHQVFVTDTPRTACSLQLLELRHRGHARARTGSGLGRTAGSAGSRPGCSPSTPPGSNSLWSVSTCSPGPATCLLDGERATAEPKKLRYRLLHIAARLVRTARRTQLRIAQRWPWAADLAAAFARLDALPRPSSRTNTPASSTRDTETTGHRRPSACPPTRQPPRNPREDQEAVAGRLTESARLTKL
jgi:Transposase DDE domain group 1